MQTADLVVNCARGLAPIDHAVVFRQTMRVGRLRVVLRRLCDRAECETVERLHKCGGAQPREVGLDLFTRVVRANQTIDRCQHRAGIECLDHTHDGDAGHGFARNHCAVHGRSTSIPRQERGVHIDHAERWYRKHRLSEDLAVGGHDADVGTEVRQVADKRRILQRRGLKHDDAGALCAGLHRRIGRLLSASAWLVWLCDDAHDLVR